GVGVGPGIGASDSGGADGFVAPAFATRGTGELEAPEPLGKSYRSQECACDHQRSREALCALPRRRVTARGNEDDAWKHDAIYPGLNRTRDRGARGDGADPELRYEDAEPDLHE